MNESQRAVFIEESEQIAAGIVDRFVAAWETPDAVGRTRASVDDLGVRWMELKTAIAGNLREFAAEKPSPAELGAKGA